MKNYQIYIAIIEAIYFIGLVIFSLYIAKEYTNLNKIKND